MIGARLSEFSPDAGLWKSRPDVPKTVGMKVPRPVGCKPWTGAALSQSTSARSMVNSSRLQDVVEASPTPKITTLLKAEVVDIPARTNRLDERSVLRSVGFGKVTVGAMNQYLRYRRWGQAPHFSEGNKLLVYPAVAGAKRW